MATGHAAGEVSSLTTRLVDLGRMALEAPAWLPTHTVGTHGEMWQWIGDGNNLVSLIVAVRPGEQESVGGLRNRLFAEVDRVRARLRPTAGGKLIRPEMVDVGGAFAAFSMSVSGTREGMELHNDLLIATDRVDMYLVHAAVPGTESGRRLASSLLSSVRLFG